MTRNLSLTWADGEYSFVLRIREIDELETKCDATFGEIFNRVMRGEYRVRDLYEIVRLGLIGGGMPPVQAKQLCDFYVDHQPLARADDPSSPYAVAVSILRAQMFGFNRLAAEDGDSNSGKTEGSNTSA